MKKTFNAGHSSIYILALVALLLVVAITLYVELVDLKDVVIALLPIVTTFAGATLAFRLNLEKEVDKEAVRRKQVLNTALFVLIQQENAITQMLRDYEPNSADFHRAFNTPAIEPPEYANLKIPIFDLSFLLETNPQLLFELSTEQERFSQAIKAVRIRNTFVLDEVQPAIERTGMLGKTVTLLDAQMHFGQRVFGAAMNHANNVIENLISSKESIPSVREKLRATAQQQFPAASFLNYFVKRD